ncbi:uncharacterized protein PHACADRAFT_261944 [Phanerochaete carnosa HHB-10118-sp]|uniref:Uncharacterized protein n=1 Tax=Phanerochaete carnosa (strain HHB-10118-sp) TaxID=650164 RepID=K5VYI2_PHACS|nr:uncharacterized protein PHACADRAFT_261944 [Phanerochaete carnosa HHB-10118-sp]EKM51669.1 hypothetical protein PHACADRAFT_261944 [Phanerochaete carnosa HHB-10118-sp]
MQDDTLARWSLDTVRLETGNDGIRAGSSAAAGETTQPEASSSRGQAGPLPAKQGEIGYVEPTPPEPAHLPTPLDVHTASPLPAVHPAERSSAGPAPSAEPANDHVSTHSAHSAHSKLLKIFKPKHIPTLFSIQLTTLCLFLLHLAVLAGTIAGWALLVQHLSKVQASSNNNASFSVTTSTIFVHVAFGLACMAQLIFIERRIFRMRAEHYYYQHPGLPLHTHGGEMNMGFAPWNRPPLPTYAAALAQSGVGTGDVEDSAIAVPPPPAYGHTRGSTLLLSGFMNNTLRAERHEARERARQGGGAEGSPHASWLSEASRPVSYLSHDEEWEERSDALRTVRLEETLARLEEARTRD